MYTADKSDVEIITPPLLSERKSLGPVAELGRSYKGTLVSHAFFDRPLELPLAARTRIHVGLHIVSTEAALVKKILNAKAWRLT